jgi:hypothetical protein
MNPQTHIPDPIREEIELARALTALLMAVKLDCADLVKEHPGITRPLPEPSQEN